MSKCLFNQWHYTITNTLFSPKMYFLSHLNNFDNVLEGKNVTFRHRKRCFFVLLLLAPPLTDVSRANVLNIKPPHNSWVWNETGDHASAWSRNNHSICVCVCVCRMILVSLCCALSYRSWDLVETACNRPTRDHHSCQIKINWILKGFKVNI